MNPDVASDRDRVGPYQLIKAVGAGGSARIDLARIDRAYGFQRHVVIKRPLEHLRGDPKAAASLRREARIGGRLRHPNLVAILDAGMHDGYDYLVLEYVHGGSLRTLMQTDTPSRVRDAGINVALAIVGDVARGLHDAHELTDEHGAPLGLVHRDVSPGNILIGLDGAVKLADFGIAKETRVQTLSGSMHGTVTYMAPEQCRGHAFDRRADVFSLGVILYELVTGTRLFWADNDVASLHRVLSGNVPRPRKLRPHIAPQLEEIVMTAVAHEQSQRFASTRDLADALELHAQQAGAILGSRWIARWVHEIIGPRDNPWIGGSTTVIDVPPIAIADDPSSASPASASITDLEVTDRDSEGSLVALIESLHEDEPPVPTFGPTNPSFSDEIDTKPRREPMRRTNKGLVAIVAAGLLSGAAATAFVMTRDGTGQNTSITAGQDKSDTAGPDKSNASESDTSNAGQSGSNAPDGQAATSGANKPDGQAAMSGANKPDGQAEPDEIDMSESDESHASDASDTSDVSDASSKSGDAKSGDAKSGVAKSGDSKSGRSKNGSKKRVTKKTNVTKPAVGSAKSEVVDAKDPDPQPVPEPTKSGSNATTRPKVEWSDRLLLPTDTGSGTKKK